MKRDMRSVHDDVTDCQNDLYSKVKDFWVVVIHRIMVVAKRLLSKNFCHIVSVIDYNFAYTIGK